MSRSHLREWLADTIANWGAEGPRDRVINWDDEGFAHTIDLPAVRATLGCWVEPSPFAGTRPYEWVITYMPVTAVPGMSSGYTWTRWGARRAALRALKFWESYGYTVNRDGARA